MNEPMEHPVVVEALKGDVSALEFVRMIALILHAWDDAIDRDSPLTDADINRAFTLALVNLPRNSFYRKHFEDLNPILVSAILNWRIATNIERSDEQYEKDLQFAYVIRSTYVDLLVHSAVLIGGIEHGVKYGVWIRRWAHDEGFDGFMKNLAAERAARKEEDVL